MADDLELVSGSTAVQRGDWGAPYRGPLNGTWRPLRVSSYQLDALLFGPRDPFGYHLSNLVLHAAGSTLVFLVAVRRLGGILPALVAGAVFLVHPLQVESVAWITGRKELLGGALALLGLWMLDPADPRPAAAARALGTLACWAAFLAREGTLMILPVILLEGWWFGDPEARRRLPRRLAGAFLGGALFSLAYLAISPLEALRAAWGETTGERLRAMLPLWGRALGLLLAPLGLASHLEDAVRPEALTGWRPASGALALSGLLLALAALRRSRLGLWALLSGGLCYLPASNLVRALRVPFAEHYLYLGLAFFALAAGAWTGRGPRRALAVLPVLCLWAGLSVARLPVWREEVSYWSLAHRQNPRTARLALNLSQAYGNLGRLGPCRRWLDRASPRLVSLEERLGAARNRGLLALRCGDREGAALAYEEAADLAGALGREEEARLLRSRTESLRGPPSP